MQLRQRLAAAANWHRRACSVWLLVFDQACFQLHYLCVMILLWIHRMVAASAQPDQMAVFGIDEQLIVDGAMLEQLHADSPASPHVSPQLQQT
jgi:hypothetical protein